MSSLSPLPLQPLVEAPLVSVLMSNHNYGRYIGEAIESVLSQTYPKLELIVCDDGSTDDSCTIIQDYATRDPRLTFLRKENGGQASGYNATFRLSRGQIICFIDADDVYLSIKLERIVRAFRSHPNCGFVGHKLIRVDEQRRLLGLSPLFVPMPTGWHGENALKNSGFVHYIAPGGGLGLRREIAEIIFPLPETGLLARYGDGSPMRLAPFLTPLVAIEEGLAEWRCHGSNQGHIRKLTTDHLKRELDSYQQFWRHQRLFLEQYQPEAALELMPLEMNTHVAEMHYTLARLEKKDVLLRWRNLIWGRAAQRNRRSYRSLFWLFSLFLPLRVFSFAINILNSPNPIKASITRVKLLRAHTNTQKAGSTAWKQQVPVARRVE